MALLYHQPSNYYIVSGSTTGKSQIHYTDEELMIRWWIMLYDDKKTLLESIMLGFKLLKEYDK